MIVESWLSGNLRAPSEEDAFKALDELEEVGEEIQRLTGEGKHWEAYTKLTGSIAFLNVASEKHPTTRPRIIEGLLNWIQKSKAAIDKIIQGIGGSGYSIGVAATFPPKVSFTVSFTVKAS